jgi:hypothetical protein
VSYRQPKEGEWENPRADGYKMACCDCGLVHKVDFRVVRPTEATNRFISKWDEVDDPDLLVMFRVFRDNRATGQQRRHRNIKVSHE